MTQGMLLAAAACLAPVYLGAQAHAPVTSNPVAYTKDSIQRGKNTYLRHCQECHDEDGKALSNVVAAAADLTRPDVWKHGADDAAVFASIKNGAGDTMPAFKADLEDDRIWDVVNFIRSIGPESRRPKTAGGVARRQLAAGPEDPACTGRMGVTR